MGAIAATVGGCEAREGQIGTRHRRALIFLYVSSALIKRSDRRGCFVIFPLSPRPSRAASEEEQMRCHLDGLIFLSWPARREEVVERGDAVVAQPFQSFRVLPERQPFRRYGADAPTSAQRRVVQPSSDVTFKRRAYATHAYGVALSFVPVRTVG